ncbi:major facilitator superfamily domain-containing protein [Trichoderma afarasin]
MNYFAMRSHSGPKYQILLIGFILTFMHFFTNQLLAAPTVAVIEYSVCGRYYSEHPNPAVDVGYDRGLLCKVEPVKDQVTFLLGWFYSIDCLPGICTALLWGHLAGRIGKRTVLAISCLGRVISTLGLLTFATQYHRFPSACLLFSPLGNLLGGGSYVFQSVILSIVSEATEPENRTRLFYLLALVMDIANIVAPPLTSLALWRNLWLPFGLSIILYGLLLATIWTIPPLNETPTPLSVHTAEENEPLLSGQNRLTESPGQCDMPTYNMHINSWTHTRQSLLSIATNQSILILLLCSFLKRVGFYSETFFIQYASEKFNLTYGETASFTSAQSFGALLTIGAVLPLCSRILQTRLGSSQIADLVLVRANLTILAAAYCSIQWAWSIPLFIIELFFCGVGEGVEPSLQGIMSSLIEPSQFAMLFTSAAFLESVGKIISSPFMASLLRMGRDYDGRVTGLPFFIAGVSSASYSMSCTRL